MDIVSLAWVAFMVVYFFPFTRSVGKEWSLG